MKMTSTLRAKHILLVGFFFWSTQVTTNSQDHKTAIKDTLRSENAQDSNHVRKNVPDTALLLQGMARKVDSLNKLHMEDSNKLTNVENDRLLGERIIQLLGAIVLALILLLVEAWTKCFSTLGGWILRFFSKSKIKSPLEKSTNPSKPGSIAERSLNAGVAARLPEPNLLTDPSPSNTDWLIIGASATGKSHTERGEPCQDNFRTGSFQNSWHYIIVSDGAGSARKAEKGSELVTKNAITILEHLSKEIPALGSWFDTGAIPSDESWQEIAVELFKHTKEGLLSAANKNGFALKDLSCTAILTLFSSQGVLMTHIGDGRAAYRDEHGNWAPLMEPWKGEEANSTVFVTSAWESAPEQYVRTKVVRQPVTAMTAMTDGCERYAFECSVMDDEKQLWQDPNRPFPNFFEPVLRKFLEMKNHEKTVEEMQKSWASYIDTEHQGMKDESDDKTLVVAMMTDLRFPNITESV